MCSGQRLFSCFFFSFSNSWIQVFVAVMCSCLVFRLMSAAPPITEQVSPLPLPQEQIQNILTSILFFFLPDDLTTSMMAARAPIALPLAQQQVAGLARAATLEQLREKLETSGGAEGPERKMARLAEEQQRLMQQAFQHNLLAMASQMPMNLRLAAPAVATRGQCCQVYPVGSWFVNFGWK